MSIDDDEVVVTEELRLQTEADAKDVIKIVVRAINASGEHTNLGVISALAAVLARSLDRLDRMGGGTAAEDLRRKISTMVLGRKRDA